MSQENQPNRLDPLGRPSSPHPIGATIEIRGRFGAFKAAGVANARASGVPVTLGEARKVAGGSTVWTNVLAIFVSIQSMNC